MTCRDFVKIIDGVYIYTLVWKLGYEDSTVLPEAIDTVQATISSN